MSKLLTHDEAMGGVIGRTLTERRLFGFLQSHPSIFLSVGFAGLFKIHKARQMPN
jgi:hypothetical protein